MPLLLGIAFWLFSLSAGFAVLRIAQMRTGLLTVALAAPVGLAGLAVLTTATAALGAPPALSTLVACVPAGGGLVLALRERASIVAALGRGSQNRQALLLLLGALALAALLIGVGFAGVDAPLSTHDGAHHVETIDAAKRGALTATWYPTGLHTAIAAFLGLVPSIDTAEGAFGASLGLSFLALMAVFGLAYAVWNSATIAAAGALAVALTFQYPYHTHFWSGWPLAAAIVLVLGLWMVALEYVRQPRIGLAFTAGILAAAIVLIHGTEVYSATIGLLVLLIASWRRLRPRQLSVHLPVALVLGLVLAAPYLSTLLRWAAAGGASAVGDLQAQAEALSPGDTAAESMLILMFNTFGTGVGFDLPLRVGLLLFGVWQSARRRTGRMTIVIGAIFLLLALAFASIHGPLRDAVYAAVFPWAQSYRLMMIAAVSAAMLQGLGAVVLVRIYTRYRISVAAGGRRSSMRRIAAVVMLLSVLLSFGSAGSLALLLSANAHVYASTSADDAAAMGWLRSHIGPGELVANDWFADAGIWIPYKAGAQIVLPRLAADQVEARRLVLDNVETLDRAPAGQIACALNVRYVFRGSKGTAWEGHHFPAVAELQQSPALNQVFASGQAVVFRTRLPCDG